jgi:hypothetical protein
MAPAFFMHEKRAGTKFRGGCDPKLTASEERSGEQEKIVLKKPKKTSFFIR